MQDAVGRQATETTPDSRITQVIYLLEEESWAGPQGQELSPTLKSPGAWISRLPLVQAGSKTDEVKQLFCNALSCPSKTSSGVLGQSCWPSQASSKSPVT